MTEPAGLPPRAADGGRHRARGAALRLRKDMSRSWLGASNALAAGLMLAASFGLVYEGTAYGLWRTLLGVVLGLAFIVTSRALVQKEDVHAGFEEMGAAGARKALLIFAS